MAPACGFLLCRPREKWGGCIYVSWPFTATRRNLSWAELRFFLLLAVIRNHWAAFWSMHMKLSASVAQRQLENSITTFTPHLSVPLFKGGVCLAENWKQIFEQKFTNFTASGKQHKAACGRKLFDVQFLTKYPPKSIHWPKMP